METDDLPNEFDVVVLGTGLTETIAAAAFSRIGLKVLHLDRNNYYGGSFANFNLQAIEEWKKKNEDLEGKGNGEHQATDDVQQAAAEEGNSLISLPCERPQAHKIKINFHVRERTPEETAVADAAKQKTKSRFSPCNLSNFTITSDQSTEEAKDESIHGENSPAESSGETTQTSTSESLETGDTGTAQPDSATTTSDTNAMQLECEDTDLKDEDKGLTETEKSSASVSSEELDTKSHEWTVEEIKEDWRKYCFDLSPRVLYCSGDLVELLIQSDVARYCEFRTVSRVLTLLNDSLQQVPCSRADVFSSKIVSLVEKRLMMKFLQFAADFESHPEEYEEHKDKSFVDFLKSKKLTANIQHFVQHAIAMVNDAQTTVQGLKITQRFLRSLGRYGNTAFLFSLYGSGELPQAFSRLSAVFGGVYCLTMSASHLIADKDNKCCGIITTQGKKINCKYVVAEASYLPSSFVESPSSRTSRAVFITDKSIRESKDPELSLLNFVCKDGNDVPVIVMELPPSACVCPKGLYVVHLIRENGSEDPAGDFTEVARLFAGDSEEDKPRILWSLYFSQNDLSQVSLTSEAIGNVLITSGGGDGAIDMEKSVKEAKDIFLHVCPDEEFLPKPPNPEDIIYVDDEEAAVASGPGEFDSSSSETQGNDKEEEKKEEEAENEIVKTD